MGLETSIADWAFCEAILPDVSRSFALIIPCCPPPIDRAMCVAYLLCRVADTIEDEVNLGEAERQRLYDAFLSCVERPEDAERVTSFLQGWRAIPGNDYGRLLRGSGQVLRAFSTLGGELRRPIETCVRDMIAGMRTVETVEQIDGVRFICRTLDDLDRYCHHVAGTVGLMSNALFQTRFTPETPCQDRREKGRRLGLGLQMTNILKDCRSDAGEGRCYLPPRYVEVAGKSTRLRPEHEGELYERALGHLDRGLEYVLEVPAGEIGIRQFLLGALLPAVATLEVSRRSAELVPKINRATMGEILTLASEHASDDGRLREWYAERRNRVLRV